MTTEQKYLLLRNIFFICIISVMLVSCGSDDKYAGTYLSADITQTNTPKQVIILKEKGTGVWQATDDEVSFTWNIKKGELRLHFKPSGVVVGQIHNDRINIELPGSTSREFIKREK